MCWTPTRLDLFSNFKRVRRGKGRRGDDPRPPASSRFADRFLSLPRARALGAERARFRWAVSGKQNRRWGMNRKSDQGSRRGPTYAESRDDPGRGEEGEGVPPLSLPLPLSGRRRRERLRRGRARAVVGGGSVLLPTVPRRSSLPFSGYVQTAQERRGSIMTAGRWSRKSTSARECVTTPLPNGTVLKMEDAQTSETGERRGSSDPGGFPREPPGTDRGVALHPDIGSKTTREGLRVRGGGSRDRSRPPPLRFPPHGSRPLRVGRRGDRVRRFDPRGSAPSVLRCGSWW